MQQMTFFGQKFWWFCLLFVEFISPFDRSLFSLACLKKCLGFLKSPMKGQKIPFRRFRLSVSVWQQGLGQGILQGSQLLSQ